MYRSFVRLLVAGAVALAGGPALAADRPPNVVLIMMDDVGFADLGAYGSEIATPHIDRLAEQGLRYSNFTVTGVCSPSRAALLTGLNHHSAGVGHTPELPRDFPGYRGVIHPNVATLPEILGDHGYATRMVGKWHLAHPEDRTEEGPFDDWPTGRGFERFFGILASHTNQWVPDELWENGTRVEVPADGSFYLPDALTDRAIEMLEELREKNPDQPFFLYYATAAAHAPHHTRPEDREKYRGRYERGYDAVRAERLERQEEIGLVPPGTPLAPYYPGVVPFADLSEEEQLVSTRLQENYAAFVDNIDQNVGRLVDWLERSGELENTILLVFSDNGASREAFTNGTTNQGRYFTQLGETHEQRMAELPAIGSPESYPNYPHGWMQASNTPFKLSKASVHGGGIRSPLVVHWPAGIEERGGLRHQFHHINDIAPTLLELLDIEHPSASEGSSHKPMEGTSFAYTLANPAEPTRKLEQYYEMEGNRAYYERGWKLVSWHPDGESHEDYPWELYHLDRDPAESNDLADQMPDKVEKLAAAFDEAARRYDVYPIDSRFPMGRADLSSEPARIELKRGAGPISMQLAPRLIMRSWSIRARLDRSGGEEGVLVAMGDHHSGYALYVRDGRLHFDVNYFGDLTRLEASSSLPDGPVEVRVDFDHDGVLGAILRGGLWNQYRFLGGDVTLRVNDEAVAQGRLPIGAPIILWEGLNVGLDRGAGATRTYAPPFPYTGELEEVVYELD